MHMQIAFGKKLMWAGSQSHIISVKKLFNVHTFSLKLIAEYFFVSCKNERKTDRHMDRYES